MPNNCSDCEHRTPNSVLFLKASDYLCEAHKAGVNNITGRMHYFHCIDYNKEGKCPKFKATTPPRFRDWIYALLIVSMVVGAFTLFVILASN